DQSEWPWGEPYDSGDQAKQRIPMVITTSNPISERARCGCARMFLFSVYPLLACCSRRAVAFVLLGLVGVHSGAVAQSRSCAEETGDSLGRFNLRMDNDMFGGADQDQGYTNGFMASWISPNLASYQDDPCIPHVVRSLNRYLAWLQPANFEEQNMTIGVGQMMYTPRSEEHTSELQSRENLVCRLLLDKKNQQQSP